MATVVVRMNDQGLYDTININKEARTPREF